MTRIRGAAWPAVASMLCLWVLAANVSPAFTPVRAEIGDARGFSRGLLNFVVLGRAQSFQHAPVWAFAVVVTAFVALALLPAASRARGAVALAVVGAALFLAAALSPYVTAYRIVLTARTFALGALLLSAPRLSAAASVVRSAARQMDEPSRRRAAVAVCAAFGCAFFASAMLQTLADYDGNYSGFLHLSRLVAGRAPDLVERPDLGRSLVVYDEGYDGQFMYLIAFDPFLQRYADRPREYRAFIDAPPYRYGRIAFPLLTRAIAAGKPALYPAVMMWLIVFSHLGLAGALAFVASRHGRPPLMALLYLGIPGFLSSLLSALPESIAAACLVGGFACWSQKRYAWAALCLAAALLVRETAIVLVAALVVATAFKGGRRPAVVLGLSLVPVAAWRLFVGLRFYSDWGWRAVVTSPGDLGIPFAGLVHLVGTGTLVFPLLLTIALVAGVGLMREGPGPLEFAAFVYGLVAVSLRYDQIWSHLPSGERGTFELFLCLLLILLGGRANAAWARRGLVALFVALAFYTAMLAPDAAITRAALLVIR